MKRSLRFLALFAFGLVLVGGPLFGQSILPKKIWSLTIKVNVPNASIYVDGALIDGNVTKVAGGEHLVKVHADGYADFSGKVNVNGDTSYTVKLVATLYPLTIRTMTPSSRVYVDGNEVTGTVPSVSPGSHTIQVSAVGFLDYTASVNVTGPLTLDVALQPLFALTINVNVPNAAITVDNQSIVGNVARVGSGQHAVSVHADGYADYTGTVNVASTMAIQVKLNPLGVAMNIRVNTPNAQVFVDGNEVTGTVPMVAKGAHMIRVTAPGFQDYNATVTWRRR